MRIKHLLHQHRYELLLFALIMVIFNKILIFDKLFYTKYVWPFNMLLLGIVSLGIFHENKTWIVFIKNFLFGIVVVIPFIPSVIFSNRVISFVGLVSYMLFYLIIFYETIKQVVRHKQVSTSVIIGSLSGFLLLIIISTFSYIIINFIDPSSFNNVLGLTVPIVYQELTYFSIITLTTIGFGDITPLSENARLLTGFWGVVGQFYMVAVVGIIISKFSSK